MRHRGSRPRGAAAAPGVASRSALASLVLCILAGGATPGAAAARLDPRLRAAVAGQPAGKLLPLWVIFTDKGTHEVEKAAPPLQLVSARSLARRAKVRTAERLVDGGDLPLDEAYVRAVTATGAHLRQRSRWLNRISVEATPAELEAIAALSCVEAVEPVARFRRAGNLERDIERADGGPAEAQAPGPGGSTPPPTSTPNYGSAYSQLEIIRVPELHARGLTGAGVLVGHFDDGYRLLAHECLDSVAVVATHDFVDGDVDPAPPSGSPTTYGAHGIATLSVLAGWAPGKLIGAAYGASYVLARTENDASETPLEEDNWIAAIEWADSLGIDVASTSLGYLTYDAPYPSWTWMDMNGNATPITRAADLAVGRGIVLVNSAGNEGFDALHNTLIAPADGDSVIAAGSVLADGTRSSFSSVGPTTDVPARIKPDFMAQGSAVRVARSTGIADYGSSSGTSFSCPLLAGAIVLLVEARPDATPMEIRTALRMTASQATWPDNSFGWGIANAAAALDYLNAADVAGTPSARRSNWLAVYPNPFNPQATIVVGLASSGPVELSIFDVRGRLVRTLVQGELDAATQHIGWDGRDDAGRSLPSGVYVVRLRGMAPGTGQLAEQKLVLAR